MTVVIDASVLVAAAHPDEPGSAASATCLVDVIARREPIVLPWLAWVETVSAVVRKTGSVALADEAGQQLRNLPARWVSLDETMAAAAVAVAASCRLRAADSVYVSLAGKMDATLLTLDREMKQRCQAVCLCQSPEDWLAT